MDISVSIVNFNTKNLIKQLIKNITGCISQLSYEIIITDNGSTDDSAEFIEKEILPEYSTVTLVRSKNYGFGAGHNLGIQQASGKYVLIINPDVIILDDAISILYEFLKEDKRRAIVGPELMYPDLTIQPSCHKWPNFFTPLVSRTPLGKTKWGDTERKRYEMSGFSHLKPFLVDWVVGACMMIRKAVWDEIGGFDTRYFMYCEDIDICRKAHTKGYEVWYNPQAHMIHFHKRLSAKRRWWLACTDKSTRIHLASHIAYFKKWGFKIQALTPSTLPQISQGMD